MFSTLVRGLCAKLASKLPLRTITDEHGDPYLRRYYLLGKEPAYFPKKVKTRLEFLPTVFLHRFVRSDSDPELHNHPWDNALSFILAGGYHEERRVGDGNGCTVIQRTVYPFTFNRIKATDFHRVDLLEHDAWSIFVTGNKVEAPWGFWCRQTNQFWPSRLFFARKTQQKYS